VTTPADATPSGFARAFLDRPALEVAPGLLGCVLEHETSDGLVAVRLTEAEAYTGAADPASHAYRGRTRRNAVMFGPPGYAYVYFTYGMHFCVNVVCGPEGTAEAVLLRAGQVIVGEELARQRRVARNTRNATPAAALPSRELARGPARLCRALGIDRGQDGADLCDPASALRLRAAGGAPPGHERLQINVGPRVGVSSAIESPWRFWLANDPTVSAYRRHTPRAGLTAASKGVHPPI
jgi:DNA-3-methyladenine glycosylase